MSRIALNLGDGPIVINFSDIETQKNYIAAELFACKQAEIKVARSVTKEERLAAKAERYNCRKQFAINQGYGPRTRSSSSWYKLNTEKNDAA